MPSFHSSVKDGKIACPRCGEMCLPDEMFSANICLKCYEKKQARDQGKPKPKGGNGSEEIKRNAMGWIEREEASVRSIDKDGFPVTDTKNTSTDISFEKPISEKGNEVPVTDRGAVDGRNKKPIVGEGNRVPETDSNRVPDTRIDRLEGLVASQGELLAEGLRRIRSLEESLNPVIERENVKANSSGMKKLRDDLEVMLKAKYLKNKIDAVYVSDLYGANGRRGGRLGISKTQAFRLRDACRTDDRFRVEKAENKSGKWLIRLNTKFK